MTHPVITALKDLIQSIEMPVEEPVLSMRQASQKSGVSRETISRLRREGRVPTYDGGRKVKVSEVQEAVKDPLPMNPSSSLGRVTSHRQRSGNGSVHSDGPLRPLNIYKKEAI